MPAKRNRPPPPPDRPLAGTSKTEAAHKRALFVAAMQVNGGNQTDAAIAAGFSQKTAGMAGSRLMARDDVKQALNARREEIVEKLGLSLERTLLEIARVAYADPRKLYDKTGRLKAIHELDDDTAASVASVEVDELRDDKRQPIGTTTKLKQWDKNAALEKAMKYHGAYGKDNEQKKPEVIIQMSDLDARL
jgi:phage terminase small subunit